jgi:hypothetical protein
MTEEIHDTSRVDKFLAARNRAMVLHSLWRPMLAGALGAALVIGAVYVALPKFSAREVVVDHVVQKDVSVDHVVSRDVTVDHVVPHEVPLDIPRIVAPHDAAPSPLARSPAERSFTLTPGWQNSDIRGRVLRPNGTGFVLQTNEGEKNFYPAMVEADGSVVLDTDMRDDVSGVLGDLAFCRPQPSGVYFCVALHKGREVVIKQVPIVDLPGRPT